MGDGMKKDKDHKPRHDGYLSRIARVEAENHVLRKRIAELEAENKRLMNLDPVTVKT